MGSKGDLLAATENTHPEAGEEDEGKEASAREGVAATGYGNLVATAVDTGSEVGYEGEGVGEDGEVTAAAVEGVGACALARRGEGGGGAATAGGGAGVWRL